MLKANAERLRREQAAATVTNLETISARIDALEVKLDRALEILEALAGQVKKAGKAS